ncbi:hypothetical protein I4F81_005009 [Pyropia yezoensis]|uniref:Uncharacterized protein n=1 Tax=Pyropia yezoensis TaxID=2788 RepID=A0ACC3BX18_PYRYE|nr:hypothetical protein I4F81_005009 [Neopyropia yezoensis]
MGSRGLWRRLAGGVVALTALSIQASPESGAGAAAQAVVGGSFSTLVTAGYQAWFSCPTSPTDPTRWRHWTTRGAPSPGSSLGEAGRITIDLFPDVREYPPEALCEAPALGRLGAGAGGGDAAGPPARLFDSAAPTVIDTHFRWMREYGLDGVGVQRFLSTLRGDDPERGLSILRHVRDAADRHGRVYYVMYDTSGGDAEGWVQTVQKDWTALTSTADRSAGKLSSAGPATSASYGIDIVGSSGSRYAHEDLGPTADAWGRRGKVPVVTLWGLGVPSRPGSGAQAKALIEWFKRRGVYVVGGVPYQWRSSPALDAVAQPGGETAFLELLGKVKRGFSSAYAALDGVQPWAVGQYNTLEDVRRAYATDVPPSRRDSVPMDLVRTRAAGQAYFAVLYPGFSWANLKPGRPLNQIPRRGGAFFWAQAVHAAGAGAGAYIAMFDEYDEATAIAKAAADAGGAPPASTQPFLTLDADGAALSADFYLRLAGAAAARIKQRPPLPAAASAAALRAPVPVPANVARLSARGTLPPDGRLASADGNASLRYQRDGNLVLYGGAGPVWASNTAGTAPRRVVVGDDGSVAVEDAGGGRVWASATGGAGAALELAAGPSLLVRRVDGSVAEVLA